MSHVGAWLTSMSNSGHVAAANVLLDAVSAFDPSLGGDSTLNDMAIKTALMRLQDIDAVQLLVDDADGTYKLDLGPLLMGACVLVISLLGIITESRGVDREAAISTIREHLDEVFPEGV